MPALSAILALVFVLAASSMAETSDTRLPGAGAFAYTGSPIPTPAPQGTVVAFR
jgi:hypothetical protein